MSDQEIIRQHANELRSFLTVARSRYRTRPSDMDLATRALGQIETTVEELNVAEEELRAQHEELIAANAALDVERERYLDLFDYAPDPYLETDINGVIRTANRATGNLFGLRPDRLEGKPLLVYIPSEDHRIFFERLEKIRTAHDALPMTFELRVAPRTGALRTMQVRVDSQAGGGSMRWLLRDVTETRRVEETQRPKRACGRSDSCPKPEKRCRSSCDSTICTT